MAANAKATPKTPRPDPGVGDTNTPQEVAQVNQAAAQGEQAIQGQESSAPAAAAPAPASSPQVQGEAAPGVEDQTLQPLDTSEADVVGGHPGGDEKYQALFGPSSRPNEPVTAGMHAPPQGRPNVSAATLQALQRAASEPGSPPAIRNLLTLLTHQVNK